MKNIIKLSICLFIVIVVLFQSDAYAAGNTTQYKYSTLLLKKTKNSLPARPAGRFKYAVPAFAWDGYDTLDMSHNEFQKVEFRVFDSSRSAPNNYPLDEAIKFYPNIVIGTPDFTYDTKTGTLTYILTEIASTRKKLTVRLYLNGYTDTAYETKHFYTNQPGYKYNGAIPSAPPPPGSVLPYMGGDTSDDLLDLEQSGWFLCDGRLIDDLSDEGLSRSEKEEFKALLTRSGNPDPNHLPDLRGYFLRGADRSSGRDPDIASRSGTGNKIGSTQDDEFRSHTHSGSTSSANSTTDDASTGDNLNVSTVQLLPAAGPGADGPVVVNGVSINNVNHHHTLGSSTGSASSSSVGGSETRPRNVYVNYIIKARW
jgi:microcystin-dependent protein